MPINNAEWCRRFVVLDGQPIAFDDRPYLPEIYASRRNMVLRCSRQTEKSTFLANKILYEACTRPGIRMLFVCPREEQAMLFARMRLLATLKASPYIRRTLLSRPRNVTLSNLVFDNGSVLHVRAAYNSADASRGITADLLLVDEFQDIAAGNLPVLQETLSHGNQTRTILTGTPKLAENHLEEMFGQSTANEWTLQCAGCQQGVILDERALGPRGLACPHCAAPLDPQTGRWVPRHPEARCWDGYWIGHPMVPWLGYDDILERQRTYDIGRFKNEVLGLPTTVGDCVVTRAELEACCRDEPMCDSRNDLPRTVRGQLVAGIDWGGGARSRTVLAIGYMDAGYIFRVCRLERFPATEDPTFVVDSIARRLGQFQIRLVAADGGGNGHVLNRQLCDKLKLSNGMFAILYSASDLEPRRDGLLWKWTVHRSASIGAMITRIKRQTFLFPRLAESASYLDEFACELAEYDDVMRTIKYTHPSTKPDDALHACNYALLLGTRKYQEDHVYES